ncbi:MAG: DMT family protein [Muribaculaceae bacterium]|nr:DMT family protein [Muribaculaceae bacterium]
MNTTLWAGVITIGMLIISNIMMTFAWYGHLKLQQMGVTSNWPLYLVILLSWGIAFLEYCFMVPANRIGFVDNGGPFSLLQLKIVQEALTLTIFTAFVTIFFKGESLHWNHFVSFGLLVLAVFFAFLDTK